MDHQRIEDTALPERYVTGRLDGPERALFEEHLVDCPTCLERIEASEGFAAGLRAVSSPVGTPASTTFRPARRAHRSTWLLVSTCAAGLVGVVLMNARLGREARELVLERTATREARAQLTSTQQQLERERTSREAAEARLAALQRPTPVRIPVLALMAIRGTATPVVELTAGQSPFLLLAEREDPPRFQSYLVTVRSTEGTVLWQGHVQPSSRDAVVVALDSGHFAPGSYSLSLEGESTGGKVVQVGRYTFRTVAAVAPGPDAPQVR
jgi:hypothetical protein